MCNNLVIPVAVMSIIKINFKKIVFALTLKACLGLTLFWTQMAEKKPPLCLPQGVKYLAIVPDPEQLVGHRNPVGICSLGVSEDGIWQPNESDHIAVQSQLFHGAVVSEAAVCPRLGEDDIDLVFLKETHQRTFMWINSAVSFDAINVQKHH